MIGLSHPSGRYWKSPPIAFLMLASFPLLIAATALRLINIGQSGWLATLLFAPFLSQLLTLYCLIAPPGYHKPSPDGLDRWQAPGRLEA